MSARLLAWFTAGLLLFNFPLLGLWDSDAVWWGLPVFPLATFLIWRGLIAGVACMLERADGGDTEP